MPEPVRLLIWDLDETFWHGTVTEGGHTYRADTHAIVQALADRGIPSGICSKNDPARIEPILRAAGIWDDFVFPSIGWGAKGPRLRDLIATIGLRPASVMFVDDSPANRNEALHFVPELQVAAETFIPHILDSPLFAGKPDPGRTRLAHYKLLERRHADAASSGGDNHAFLRASGLEVRIEHDVDGHVDRVIELINRTNQLNFTKRRLPEDPVAARATLRQMQPFVVQTGLVHVQDRYGDYGLCGFYAVNALTHELLHFCFSCRILGMGVEHWLYARLGRPSLGPPPADAAPLEAPHPPVDWSNATPAAPGAAAPAIGTVMLRGGCELQAVAHYLGLAAAAITGEFFEFRHGLPIRIDHTVFLRHAMDGAGPAIHAAAAPLGYRAADFQTAVFDTPAALYVFSFWRNASSALYRHRRLGFEVPFTLPAGDNALNVLDIPPATLDAALPDPFARAAVEHLRAEFAFTGVPGGAALQADVARVLDHLPPGAPVFMLLMQEHLGADGQGGPIPHHIWTNGHLRAACEGRANVTLLRIEDHLHAPADTVDGVHFARPVYHRLAQSILRGAAERRGWAAEPATHAPAAPPSAASHATKPSTTPPASCRGTMAT